MRFRPLSHKKEDMSQINTVKYVSNTDAVFGDKLQPADRENPQKSMLLHGFSSVKQEAYGVHPLEELEKSNIDRCRYQELSTIRLGLGIHAPLRILAERRAASQIGHLPILPRSNFQLDVLDGRDETLLPEDIFNDPREFQEVSLPVHLTMERELGF